MEHEQLRSPRFIAIDRDNTQAPATELGVSPVGATERARVVRVIDGDTIVVDRGSGNETVRYIGVDTPETKHPTKGLEPWGPEATAINAQLVEGKQVILEHEVSERDRHNRLLRHVWVEMKSVPPTLQHVGYALVRSGLARATAYSPDLRYGPVFAELEAQASASGVGIWQRSGRDHGETPDQSTHPSKSQNAGGPDGCHPSYSPCLPLADDLDCEDVRELDKDPVEVIGRDEYRLDGDGDGIGCEP